MLVQTKEMNTTLAWHFVGNTLRDGAPIPADGVKLTHHGPLKICESGLHASVRLIDALKYAPGVTLCRVECSGTINHQNDKLVCSERTIIWRVDAEDFLRLFARQCALDVIHLWNAPDVVRRYLETGDDSLRAAARNAAAAVSAAAWAARAAADAAWDAAWDATRAAAWAAAWDAAWAAERDAVRAVEMDAQNDRLEALAFEAHQKG